MRKNKKLLILCSTIVVILVAIALAVTVVNRKNSEGNNTPGQKTETGKDPETEQETEQGTESEGDGLQVIEDDGTEDEADVIDGTGPWDGSDDKENSNNKKSDMSEETPDDKQEWTLPR